MKDKPGSSEFFVITGIIFEEHEETELCNMEINTLRQRLNLNNRFAVVPWGGTKS